VGVYRVDGLITILITIRPQPFSLDDLVVIRDFQGLFCVWVNGVWLDEERRMLWLHVWPSTRKF